jgi:hypothetical protein
MAKWPSRLVGLTSGLLLALAVHFAWRWHQPLTLCDIDRNPDKYGGKIVRVRALVSNDVSIGGPFNMIPNISVFSTCHGTDDWPSASVELDTTQLSLVRESRHLWRQDDDEKAYISDVILIGRFEPPDGMLHCFSPKYQISNASIERILYTQELTHEQVFGWIKSKAH